MNKNNCITEIFFNFLTNKSQNIEMQTNLYSLFLPQNFFSLTENISIVFLKEILLYQLSVSADKTKKISVFYRYRPIRNLKLSIWKKAYRSPTSSALQLQRTTKHKIFIFHSFQNCRAEHGFWSLAADEWLNSSARYIVHTYILSHSKTYVVGAQ